MPATEKPALKKYVTTMRDGKPFTDYTPEYKAHLRHQKRWSDRIASAIVGLAGAGVIGAVVAAASYVLPLIPVASQGAMAALSVVAFGTGLLAAAGVAAAGFVAGAAGLAVLGGAGLLAASAAVNLYFDFEREMITYFRPASALATGGATLAVALGVAVGVAPETQPPAVSKVSSVAIAFDAARAGKMNAAPASLQKGPAAKKFANAM
ncbi:MAG TPA: hypothetical protein VEF76_08850 [Patescibacteria group bacterium]|nr:hypothetical protein [Patescibacteria group bacterium]